MYSEQYEEYLTSEFNRTHVGMKDLINAEKHNLDLIDPCAGYEEEHLIKLVVTGHRPDKLLGYEIAALTKLVELAKREIRAKNPDVVIAGGAMGWDMACEIATIQLRDQEHMKVQLWIYVPFGAQSSTWKDEKILAIYVKTLVKADRVMLLQRGAPKDKSEAVQWLQARNERMIDDGDKILALHNGTRGGTYNALQYAAKMGRPVHNCWPAWKKMIEVKPGVAKPRRIDSFKGDYEFLSNFSPAQVKLDGEVYPTTEHAYQAAKFPSLETRHIIRTITSPGEAKRFAKNAKGLREDWDKVKLEVMRDLLRQKFGDPKLRQKLIDTAPAELVEGNTWGDQYWGVCDGKGQNWLGKLLMEIRAQLVSA